MLESKSEIKSGLKNTFEIDFGGDLIKSPIPLLTNNEAFVFILKSILGMGVLSLSSRFGQVGFILGLITLIINGLMTLRTVQITLEVSEEVTITKSQSFKNLAGEVFGNWGRITIGLCIALSAFMTGLDYLAYVIPILKKFFCLLGFDCSSYMPALIITALITLPLICYHNLKSLSLAVFIALGLTFFSLGTQLIYNASLMFQNTDNSEFLISNLPAFGVEFLPLFFAKTLFAFNFFPYLFLIRENMAKPKELGDIVYKAISFSFILYIILPLTSFIAMRTNIPSQIFNSLPNNFFFSIVIVAYSVNLSISYCLKIYTFLDLVERSSFLKRRLYDDKKIKIKNNKLRIFIRFLTTALIFIITLQLTSYGTYLYIPVNLGLIFANFIFPILLHQKVFEGRIPKSELVFNWFLCAFGTIVGFWSLYQFILTLI